MMYSFSFWFGRQYNDKQLVIHVNNMLISDILRVDATGVNVIVAKGVISLTGTVHKSSDRDRIEEIIRDALCMSGLRYDHIVNNLILSDPAHSDLQLEEIQKHQRRISSHTSFKKCSYCNGTGLVKEKGSMIRQNIPLRYGNFGNLRISNGEFSTCPVCQGKGHCELPPFST